MTKINGETKVKKKTKIKETKIKETKIKKENKSRRRQK